jgi:hypothetical protein
MGGRQIYALYRPLALTPQLQSGLTKARREGGEVGEFREPKLAVTGAGIGHLSGTPTP